MTELQTLIAAYLLADQREASASDADYNAACRDRSDARDAIDAYCRKALNIPEHDFIVMLEILR
jgi:hypothetical protein